ncbi:MAG: hypothetical protein HFJ92_09240 [Muribaculaceae bacterium]|nr:hypothetical protein [uncultured Duncaniella sp.]MCI9173275.1 hypothetical protein [Muribaculaceae bacterium]
MIKFDPYRRRLKNNRKETRGRRIQLAPACTSDDIFQATSTIEALRRARSMKNIQHHS